MNTRVLSRRALAGALSICLSAGGALVAAQAQSPPSATTPRRPRPVATNGQQKVLVELQQDPGAVAYAVALERSGTRNAAARLSFLRDDFGRR